jgi:hypothetical protein
LLAKTFSEREFFIPAGTHSKEDAHSMIEKRQVMGGGNAVIREQGCSKEKAGSMLRRKLFANAEMSSKVEFSA